ncbi:MAG TPA: NAD(P)H-hydrate dehydratase [Aciduliprofundum sp.]|nr:NAD(P)H-hydrate dehydratase [Aciduliprofundum sp.]
MKVCRVEEIRRLDSIAVEQYGVDHRILMENAGHAVYAVIEREIGVRGLRFLVISGTGNNGGDGFVVARKIESGGGEVRVVLVGDPSRLRSPAKENYELVVRRGIEVTVVQDDPSPLEGLLGWADAVVDALLGTGLNREVRGVHARIIDMVNSSGLTVVSVDIPSGVAGDTGRVMGTAVRADYTVTFGLPKIGNVLYPGHELCGRLFVSHISYPRTLVEADFVKVELNAPVPLPPRPRQGHKGTFGKALFVAGAYGYFGAPFLSSLAHLKAGGGYSRLATPRSAAATIASRAPEVVMVPMPETEKGTLSRAAKERILELVGISDIVVVGPGLSLEPETQELVLELAEEVEKPLIIDGDGLTAISRNPSILEGRVAPTILTPHPGEMSRITGVPVSEILADPLPVLRRASRTLNSIIVLKIAHSLIGMPDGRVYVNMTGNPGMGTAGSGDVLNGTITAMHGLGLGIEEAVRMGVLAHGLAGDLAAALKGEDGMTAVDVLESLPDAVRILREEPWRIEENYFPKVVL